MSTTSVGLNAQMKAWIHGTTGKKPAQPISLTASAFGCLRAIAMSPASPPARTGPRARDQRQQIATKVAKS
jgi:hypothetical protein